MMPQPQPANGGMCPRADLLLTHVPRLLLDYLDESKHVFQRYVPLNIMSRSENVSAITTEFQEIFSLLADILAGAVGQSPLR